MNSFFPCFRKSRKTFIKIHVLKHFATFTGKHQCWSLFLIKLQALRCFTVKLPKCLRAPFRHGNTFYRTPPVAASVVFAVEQLNIQCYNDKIVMEIL